MATKKPASKKAPAKKTSPAKKTVAKKAGSSKEPSQKQEVKPPTPSQRLQAIGIDAICEYIASGESLLSWCRGREFAIRTVLDWIEAEPDRAAKYAHAREARADAVFESLDDVSDQATRAESQVEVAGLRLKADNIKWKLARMAPKKYGDKVEIEHKGNLAALSDEQVAAQLGSLLAKAGLTDGPESSSAG